MIILYIIVHWVIVAICIRLNISTLRLKCLHPHLKRPVILIFALYLLFRFFISLLSLNNLNLTTTYNGAFLRFIHGLAWLARLLHYYSFWRHSTGAFFPHYVDDEASLAPGDLIIVNGEMGVVLMVIAYGVFLFIVALGFFWVFVWFGGRIYTTRNDNKLLLNEIFRSLPTFPSVRLLSYFHGFLALFAFFLFLFRTFLRRRYCSWTLELLYHQLREVLFVHLESHLSVPFLFILPVRVHCHLQQLDLQEAAEAAFVVGFQVVAVDGEGEVEHGVLGSYQGIRPRLFKLSLYSFLPHLLSGIHFIPEHHFL